MRRQAGSGSQVAGEADVGDETDEIVFVRPKRPSRSSGPCRDRCRGNHPEAGT